MHELAQLTGAAPAQLARWHEQGLLGDHVEGSVQDAIERVRLMLAMLERGIAEDQVVLAVTQQKPLIDRVVHRWLTSEPPALSLAGAATELGLDPDLAVQLLSSAGIIEPDLLTRDDIEALQAMKQALDYGFTAEAMVQLMRVYSDAFHRIAEAEVRLFHIYVLERLRAEGLTGDALAEEGNDTGAALQALVEPTLLRFHRRAWRAAMREDLVNHVAEAAGLGPTIDASGMMPAAVAFIDLSGFTALTSAMGDETAAAVINRFATIVRQTVQTSPGQVVKQIGDGFMLLFPDANPAVSCGLRLEGLIRAEPQFPAARVGIHWGPVLYRDGDYVGANVNLASRITTEAEPHQVVATLDVRKAAANLDVDWVPLGRSHLKGVPDEVELFEARTRSTSAGETDKPCDPVCRMELTPSEVAAEATIDGSTHVFCSAACLQRFVADTGTYH
jgi:adenylate cyclase